MSRQQRRLLAIMTLWFAMALIDVGIVNVALPAIHQELGATRSDLQWILSGYALSFGVLLIAAGRAGDILGRGGMFLLGLVVFTAASLAASLAPSPAWLNGARFVEGLGAACMSPQVYGMVQEHFQGAARGRAFGLLGVATALSVAIAPTLGGALIALGGPYWGWRLTFLVNVPMGLVGLVLTLRWFPRPLWRRPRMAGLLAALDPLGGLLAGLAVLALLLPFVESGRAAGLWLLLPVAALLTGLWIAWEARLARTGGAPMVDLHIFGITSFRNGLAIQTIYFLGMTSVWVLVALYVQESAGFSALQAGLLAMPPAVAAALAAHWAGRHVTSMGRQLVIGGQLVTLLGLLLACAVVALHARLGASAWWLLPPLLVYGLGQGATVSPNQTLTLQEAPVAYAGSSGALISTSQRIGSSVGIAMVTAVAFGVLRVASWHAAVLAGLGCIMALVAVSTWVGVIDQRTARRS